MSEAKVVEIPQITAQGITSEERTWAALAHLSSLATLLLALGTLGLGGLLFVFAPLAIYLLYRDKSEYVAFHAMQAFVLQLVLSVGFFTAIIVGIVAIVIAWVITGVLSAILIGLILIPVAIVLTVAIVLGLVAAPFVLGGFSIAATIQSAGGQNYSYPYIGQWVENWLDSSNPEAPPAV